MSRVRLFVSLLLLLGAFAAFADDPPPGTVDQRTWLRPCLDSGSVAHEQCASIESNVQVYNFYTHNEYLKDAVYRVDRSPVSESKLYAYAVKQSVTVARTTTTTNVLDNSAALVSQRETHEVQPDLVKRGWAYKKKD
jgi:hypothetical protein